MMTVLQEDCAEDEMRLLKDEANYCKACSNGKPGAKTQDPANKEKDDTTWGGIEPWPFMAINMVVVFITCATRLRVPLLNQFLYSQFALELLGNSTVSTASDPCPDAASSLHPDHDTTAEVQDMTSRTLFRLEMITFSFGTVTTFILGALSTALPRRTLILLPTLGFLARCVTLSAVATWDIALGWLYVGCLLEGLCGGQCTIFLGSLLYTTDITPRDRKRTLGVSILENTRGLIGAIFNIFAGHLIQRAGFEVTAFCTVGLTVVCVCFVIALPTRKPSKPVNQWRESLATSVKTMLSPRVSQTSEGRGQQTRLMVMFASVAFSLSFITSFAVQRVRILYLMNVPFCWDAIHIGWYQFGREVLHNAFAILSVPLLYRFLPGVGIGILGAAANMAEFLAYALSTKVSQLYIALALSFGQSLPVNLIRGETSRLHGPEMQGPLFAKLALLENMSFAIGTSMISIYTATLTIFPGLIFLVFAAIKILVCLNLGAFQVLWLRSRSVASEKECLLQKNSTTQEDSTQDDST